MEVKNIKKFISVILALVVACSTMVVAVSAAHIKYGTGINGIPTEICYNVTCDIVHSKHIGEGIIGTHTLSDGTVCYISGLTMEHTVKCSECGQIFEKYNKRCTISHSACGEYYKNCLKE